MCVGENPLEKSATVFKRKVVSMDLGQTLSNKIPSWYVSASDSSSSFLSFLSQLLAIASCRHLFLSWWILKLVLTLFSSKPSHYFSFIFLVLKTKLFLFSWRHLFVVSCLVSVSVEILGIPLTLTVGILDITLMAIFSPLFWPPIIRWTWVGYRVHVFYCLSLWIRNLINTHLCTSCEVNEQILV